MRAAGRSKEDDYGARKNGNDESEDVMQALLANHKAYSIVSSCKAPSSGGMTPDSGLTDTLLGEDSNHRKRSNNQREARRAVSLLHR